MAQLESTISAKQARDAKSLIDRIIAGFDRKLVGQEQLRTSLIVALITGGHILLESVPGLAKTTAASTLAETVAAKFTRIQCTPDLLPSDITGTQVYDARTASFTTVLGPVHANIVLLDEINRSSAKTQSAMLEAMQERQTSIGGVVHRLPNPFMVIATQNPIEQEGTYPLPEAQLDRFLLKEVLDYPTSAEELVILERIDSGVFAVDAPGPKTISLDEVLELQATAAAVYVDESVKRYLVALTDATRNPSAYLPAERAGLIDYGASPRASIAFLQASRALALVDGRDHVIPEDVKHLAHRVLRHRVVLTFEAEAIGVTPEQIIDELLAAVPAP
jgi:MoxR-like ATPase